MAREANAEAAANAGVLRSKRNATRYEILVGIAERQPAVSQQEIAEAIDVIPPGRERLPQRLR